MTISRETRRDLPESVAKPAVLPADGIPRDGTAITTRTLTKRFRSGQVAVNALDLAVPRGAVYGFLGPNGSGKTTTIRMLLGLIAPTAGSVAILGAAMPAAGAAVLPRVGALIEGPAFHPYLSGWANLRRLDAVDRTADPRTSRTRIEQALSRVGLSNAAGKRYRQYSLGMKQRLGLAAALLQPRELLVLDEPTNGLDPQGTREVRSLIRDLAADGTTVFVSSHLLAEIEQVCSHVGIMSQGSLVLQGGLDALRAAQEATVTVTTPDLAGAAATFGRLGLVGRPLGVDRLQAAAGSVAPEELARALVTAGVPLRGLLVTRPTLEELFVTLTGEGFDIAR